MKSDTRNSPVDFFSHMGRGFLMGTAEIIPGVSGGTVALIVGIYERLIRSITDAFAFLFSLFSFNKKEIASHFKQIDWSLLIPLLSGMFSAIILLARLLEYLLEMYPVECRGVFFGLIAASVAIPWLRIEKKKTLSYLLALIAGISAFLATGLSPHEIAQPGYLQVFGGATVAICAMILPGVSGAFLLLVFGLYAPTMTALNAHDIPYIATFVAGAATGIGLFSSFLKWLLNRYHDATMAALTGLMLGSLRALWPWQECQEIIVPGKSELIITNCQMLIPASADSVWPVAGLAALGFFAVVGLLIWEQYQRRDAATV